MSVTRHLNHTSVESDEARHGGHGWLAVPAEVLVIIHPSTAKASEIIWTLQSKNTMGEASHSDKTTPNFRLSHNGLVKISILYCRMLHIKQNKLNVQKNILHNRNILFQRFAPFFSTTKHARSFNPLRAIHTWIRRTRRIRLHIKRVVFHMSSMAIIGT